VDWFLETMEHAKKLILIEPRLLEQLQARSEYKELQKPTDKKSKAALSMDLRNMLDVDDDVGDDIKAKLYQQTFSKFRAMRDNIPEADKVDINTLTPPVRQQTPQRTPQRRHPYHHQSRRTSKIRPKAVAWDQY